jgi:hypothetical protein
MDSSKVESCESRFVVLGIVDKRIAGARDSKNDRRSCGKESGRMKEFEKASEELEKDIRNYDVEEENVIEFLRGTETATVTFSQGRYITRIEKLAKKHPDKVQIVARNKNSIVAHIPVKAIKINIIEGRERTEEEIERSRKALAEYRESKQQSFVTE